MTKYLMAAVVTLALLAPAAAQSSSHSFYDGQGRYAGQETTRRSSTSYSDGQGRFAGSSMRHGNSTTFFDRQGRYSGSVVDTSPRR